jgi:hypothetical protein
MLTSITARRLNQINDQMGIPNRFNQSEIDSSASMVEPFDAFLAIECDHGSLRATNPVAPHLGNLLAIDSNRGSERKEIGGPSSWTAQLQAVCATPLDGTPFPFAADDPIDSMAAIDAIRSHGEWQAGLTAAVSRSWPG